MEVGVLWIGTVALLRVMISRENNFHSIIIGYCSDNGKQQQVKTKKDLDRIKETKKLVIPEWREIRLEIFEEPISSFAWRTFSSQQEMLVGMRSGKVMKQGSVFLNAEGEVVALCPQDQGWLVASEVQAIFVNDKGKRTSSTGPCLVCCAVIFREKFLVIGLSTGREIRIYGGTKLEGNYQRIALPPSPMDNDDRIVELACNDEYVVACYGFETYAFRVDEENGSPEFAFKLPSAITRLTCVCIDSEDWVVLAGSNGYCNVYDTTKPKLALESTFSQHKSAVYTVDVAKTSKVAVSGSGGYTEIDSDFSVYVWCMKTGSVLHQMTTHTNLVSCVRFIDHHNNDKVLLATSSWDGTIRVYDLNYGNRFRVLSLQDKLPREILKIILQMMMMM